jgi:ABC-type sugar transport system permease subunit
VFRNDRSQAITAGQQRQLARPRRSMLGSYGYLFVAPFFIAFAIFQAYPILYSSTSALPSGMVSEVRRTSG